MNRIKRRYWYESAHYALPTDECKILLTENLLCYYAKGKNIWLGTIRDGKKYVVIIEGVEEKDEANLTFFLWNEADALYSKIQSNSIKKAHWSL